jgi:hypothetical protein
VWRGTAMLEAADRWRWLWDVGTLLGRLLCDMAAEKI